MNRQDRTMNLIPFLYVPVIYYDTIIYFKVDSFMMTLCVLFNVLMFFIINMPEHKQQRKTVVNKQSKCEREPLYTYTRHRRKDVDTNNATREKKRE